MRRIALIAAMLSLLTAGPVFAQEWIELMWELGLRAPAP